MHCIKCGCEIPDGEIFCVACSLSPAMDAAQKPAKAKPQPVKQAEAQKPQPQATAKTTPPPAPKKKMPRLLIPFVLALLLTIGLGIYLFTSYDDIARQARALQVRDADLIIKEKDFQATELALADANTKLEESNGKIYDLNQEIDRLEAESLNWNSLASQSEFDLDTKTQEMNVLTEENAQLVETVQSLEGSVADLESNLEDATEENTTLSGDLKTAQAKNKFMDQYVVFINVDDDNQYYHSYDCSQFVKNNFFAYNPKLAESEGYSPCPHCRN